MNKEIVVLERTLNIFETDKFDVFPPLVDFFPRDHLAHTPAGWAGLAGLIDASYYRGRNERAYSPTRLATLTAAVGSTCCDCVRNRTRRLGDPAPDACSETLYYYRAARADVIRSRYPQIIPRCCRRPPGPGSSLPSGHSPGFALTTPPPFKRIIIVGRARRRVYGHKENTTGLPGKKGERKKNGPNPCTIIACAGRPGSVICRLKYSRVFG